MGPPHDPLLRLLDPEQEIGAFICLRWHPHSSASTVVCIWRGFDNVVMLDMEHVDTDWDGLAEGGRNAITTDNGTNRVPGARQVAKVSYRSAGMMSPSALTQTLTAASARRSHVMPGEDKDSNPALQPGGLEQLMPLHSELDLRGALRDRLRRGA